MLFFVTPPNVELLNVASPPAAVCAWMYKTQY